MDTTLLKGLHLLERLVGAKTSLGISALATELNLPKSNVHRTLSTLVEAGYADQDSAGNYFATLRTWELGTQVMSRHPVRRAALAYMHDLYDEVGETVNLVLLDGTDSIYIHQITSSKPIRASSTIGARAPAILTVSGKAMLAMQPDYEKNIRAIYAQQKTPKPTFTLTELLKEVATIRHNSYAMAASLWRPGVNSVAGVILGAEHQPIAAIAIAGAKERFTEKKMKTITPSLLNACTHIGKSLGA